jgi:hypothetical protein
MDAAKDIHKEMLPIWPVPLAARSKVQVYGRSTAENVGSYPTGGIGVCCEFFVFSGRGLCDELTTRPADCGASLSVI